MNQWIVEPAVDVVPGFPDNPYLWPGNNMRHEPFKGFKLQKMFCNTVSRIYIYIPQLSS